MMGLNFYGNDYILPRGGGPIVGHDFIKVLLSYTQIASY
jgi:chitinase domain-containing protein 1